MVEASQVVRLAPMNEAEFQVYWDAAIPQYAHEHVAAGNWSPENALNQAEEEYRRLLPDGLASQNQHLFTLKDAKRQVGMLWFALQEKPAGPRIFVFDIQIDEPFRRRGYATQAFRALEEKARELGVTTIALHVFGHNRAARAMYEKLGYSIKSVIMAKTISAGSET